MVYTECAETASVSRGASHVTTKHRCRYTISVDIRQNALKKKRRKKSYSHSYKITCKKRTVNLLDGGEKRYIKASIIIIIINIIITKLIPVVKINSSH